MSNAPLLEDLECELRTNFLVYSSKAYDMLPKMKAPRILDVGCGDGIPTIEVARMSGGTIIGLDINEEMLDRLRKKVMEAGLEDRIKARHGSMTDMVFPEEHFDIIWSEGSIQVIGFKKGLTEWKHFLKKKGCLVIHYDLKDHLTNLEHIPECGYDLIGHFKLPDNAWWDDYYGPLEARLPELYDIYEKDPEAIVALNAKKNELEKVKKDLKAARSVFYVVQKN